MDQVVTGDVTGSGEDRTFGSPDFNVRQFRSNAVLRWEYQPGSALFLVWSQGLNHYANQGEFDFRGSLDNLFDQPAENVFMLKLSYWIG